MPRWLQQEKQLIRLPMLLQLLKLMSKSMLPSLLAALLRVV